ncbi:MAG TPA: peptidoglycan DD-metalloendopeptidase family protein [Acidimicrobiales bacterium]|nr:peptidoglycan DD-metalloendopeptidase family protein [Acidimicrobiales bacterium]
MRRSAAAVVLATLVALLATTARPAAATGPAAVTYRPPVDAPVVDAFRPPAESWNAGNRGLEYATAPGTAVGAAADGEVVFAGPVAGGLHVVVLHDDGLRTSYSFLERVSVRRGDKVRQGQPLGTTRDRFHFGVRAGDAYLDPAKLFGGPPQVHLVPDDLRRPQSEAEERSGLARLVTGLADRAKAGGAAAVEWARDKAARKVATELDELRGAIHFAMESNPVTHVTRFANAAHEWWKSRQTCTPADVAPPKPQERRLAVTVAGLGSDGDQDSVDSVDTAGLGYAKADVVRFSYRAGTTAESGYAATDTTQDIHHSARLLRDLLERLQIQLPGVPIDVIAHGQGGIVARAALTDEVDRADPRLPAVTSLITLGSPHGGAPAATALTMFAHSKVGDAVEKGFHHALPDLIDPQGTSVTQLAEQSDFMRDLNRRPLPEDVNVTSIGARDDVTVPAGVTHLAGAENVVVSAPGSLDEHSDMPAAAQTHREIALGLAGLAPTCQSLGDALADAIVSDAIRYVETGVGGTAWMGGRYADRRIKALLEATVPRRSD